jgi:hypothetical protein
MAGEMELADLSQRVRSGKFGGRKQGGRFPSVTAALRVTRQPILNPRRAHLTY